MFERKTPIVSIVVPSWFKEGMHGKYGENETFWFACECLYKLIAVTPKEDYELIIINNGSSLKDVKDYFSMADVLITNKENLGFAPACNQGFALARGRYVVCINNDVLVWSGWLNAMIEVIEDQTLEPKPGIVMPALMKQTKDANEAIKMEKIDLSVNYDKIGPGAEFGSCWITKRSIMEKVEELNEKEIGQKTFYDENFKLGMGEDRKAWQQIRLLGHETYRTHKTRVWHAGNMSMTKIKNRKDYTIPNREYLAKWKKKHNIK